MNMIDSGLSYNRLISPKGLERLIASDFSVQNPFHAEDFYSIIIETRL